MSNNPQTFDESSPLVGVVMGSQSDMSTMQAAVDILQMLDVPHEVKIISAHRTPKRMVGYAETAKERGIQVIIAGAGGAAHLPGMLASLTSLPVLGVPVESKALKGMDSLLSIVQMPGGIPVGTFAIGTAGAKNAALMATAILSLKYQVLDDALTHWRTEQTENVALEPVYASTEGAETSLRNIA